MIIRTDRAEREGWEPRAGQRDRKSEGESDISRDRAERDGLKPRTREQRSNRIEMREKNELGGNSDRKGEWE